MMLRLYTLLVWIALPFAQALVLWRGLALRDYWRGGAARFGGGARLPQSGNLWVHAVSVGEVQAAAALLAALRAAWPQRAVVLTTATPAGHARARQLFGAGVEVRYAPYDLPWCLRRALARLRPALCVVVETELWPNLYRVCADAQVPMLLASARVSERTARRLGRFPGLLRAALAANVEVAAQTQADAARFRALGVPAARIAVTGNIKFDRSLPEDWAQRAAVLRAAVAGPRTVWVAGSTHPGEEEVLLQVQRGLQRRLGEAAPLLVIAPRHSRRFDEVAQRLADGGWRCVRRSAGGSAGAAQVLLLDTLGELMEFYAIAAVAFVGGSLVPVGGHNLLEPAQLGVPVVAGPHLHSQADIARHLRERGALVIAADAAQLEACVAGWLSDPQAAAAAGAAGRAAVADNRGATGRTVARAAALLDGGLTGRGPEPEQPASA